MPPIADKALELIEKLKHDLALVNVGFDSYEKELASLRSENERLRKACEVALKDIRSTRESGDAGNYDKQPSEIILEAVLSLTPTTRKGD